MNLGFTGTQSAISPEQFKALSDELGKIRPSSIHHGMCTGADETMDIIARIGRNWAWSGFSPHIIGYPGIKNDGTILRGDLCVPDEIREPKPCLDRSHDIVDETDTLWAVPKGHEHMRSGTWATVRYARKKKRPIVIFWVDGTITRENLDIDE